MKTEDKPAKPEPTGPRAMPGDQVFFDRKAPRAGRVVSSGEHGAVIEHGGGRRDRVRWDHVLGHQSRSEAKLDLVAHGEDGFVVRDGQGRRRYIEDPLGAGTPMAKARPLLFLTGEALVKAAPLKNRAGLSLKDVTDKAGHHTKRWSRSAADAPAPQRSTATERAEPPPHKVGEHVSFEAGAFKGEGEVLSVGHTGAWIKDSTGRRHKVDWQEVKGAAGEGGAKADDGAPPAPEPDAAAVKLSGAGGGGDGGDDDLQALERENDAGAKKAGMADLFPAEEGAALPHKSTMAHTTWEAISAKQEEAQEQMTSILKSAAEAVGATQVKRFDAEIDRDGPIWGMGPPKTETSARDKAKRKYGGDLSRLGDAVRGSMGFDSVEQLKAGLEKLRAAGLKLAAKPDNKFIAPTSAGYRDINLNVLLPNGVVGELQLHLKPILKAKRTGHHDYDVSRELEKQDVLRGLNDDERGQLQQSLDKQRRLYGQAMREALRGGADQPNSKSEDRP